MSKPSQDSVQEPTIMGDQEWPLTDNTRIAARLDALEKRVEEEKAISDGLREQLRRKKEKVTTTDGDINDQVLVSLLTTFNKASDMKSSPWKTVIHDIDEHKDAVMAAMEDTRGEGWVSTMNLIAAMVTQGDVQPREMMMLATMVPGASQAERNAALYYLARPRLYEQWLRSHNVNWLRRAGTPLEMDQGARVTARYPYMPMQHLSEKVAEVNRTVEGWASAKLRESSTDEVQGGGAQGQLTFAELAARDARKIRGGAPFLPHVVNNEGATVTEAAQVAEALHNMQQQINQLQQQLHRTPDTGVQQRLDAIQQLLLAQQPLGPRKQWSQWQTAQPARRTRVRGAGADADSGDGEQQQGNE